jgi:Holliday junction resolvasome RuvABC endonuclease subunit
MRVVGLDISIGGTGYAEWSDGYAHFDTARFATEKAPTEKGVQPTLEERHDRLQVIEDRIVARIYRQTPVPDLVVVEGPSMGSIQGAHDISGNWWRIVGRLMQAGLKVAEVSPGQVKQYATGSGATRGANKVTKAMVVEAVRGRYDTGPIGIKSHDKADAIVLAAIGCRLLGHPVDPLIPALNLRALTKIRLPEGL